jgi:hypothetical protein
MLHEEALKKRKCLARQQQPNRKDLEDREEIFLGGLRGLCGSGSGSIALFSARFTDG